MYKTHQPQIEAYAAQGPDQTAQVCRFVLLTVRRHLENAIPMAQGKREIKGTRVLHSGLAYVEGNKDSIYHALFINYAPITAMIELCMIPGIGIVKAGFIIQLCHGDIGCLDSHNLKMYGLDAKAFSVPATVTALATKIRLYMDVCASLGGAETLWNNWCAYVASLRPKVWPSAEAVSAAHVEAICI